jgi:CRP-like cAMP-binding protein
MTKRNLLLASLPREVYDKIEPDLERLSLAHGEILHSPGETIRHLYFPVDCLISVTVTMREGRTAEASAIGNREAAGINAFMGGKESTQTEYIVQVPGEAMRIASGALKQAFDRSTDARHVMLKYTQAYIAQISQNTACNRLHTLKQRFARWLLEVRDRIQLEELRLTQEFISHMLGVRRAGVTDISSQLEAAGLIQQSRGYVRIVDRRGLEASSCECYEVLKEEYNRLLRDPR